MIVAIVNDYVVNEIRTIQTDAEYHELKCQIAIDITNIVPRPEVGWVFDGVNLVGPSTTWAITRLALRSRFLTSELIAVYNASTTNTFFKVLLDSLSVATFIDLKRPDTIAGLNALWQYGVISKTRIEEILNTKPTEIEIYRG